MSRGRLARGKDTRIVVVTDPGPDPDDVKALLVAAVFHRQRAIRLLAVVANGGHLATERACLARCILDHAGVPDVPVGIGSEGQPTSAQPHEFAIERYDEVDRARLLPGERLLARTLAAAPPASLTWVCISSLRDIADLIAANESLFVAKTAMVSIQGGLERDAATGEWRADNSVNNVFDPAAATFVYGFCLARGVRMTVVSRHAVPLLPMQLARSFAQRVPSPVLTYLADAQFRGLEGLWRRLCAGELPARCSKQWYFETFCGITPREFELKALGRLDASAPIIEHLNGFVKPYDVLAMMAVLPITRALLPKSADVLVGKTTHTLMVAAEHALEAIHVVRLLREVYHEIAEASAPPDPVRLERFPSITAHLSLSPQLARRGRSSAKPSSSILDRLATGEAVSRSLAHSSGATALRAARVSPARVDGAAALAADGASCSGQEATMPRGALGEAFNEPLGADQAARLISLARASRFALQTRLSRALFVVGTTLVLTVNLLNLAVWLASAYEDGRIKPDLSFALGYIHHEALLLVTVILAFSIGWPLTLLSLKPGAPAALRMPIRIASIAPLTLSSATAILAVAVLTNPTGTPQLANNPLALPIEVASLFAQSATYGAHAIAMLLLTRASHDGADELYGDDAIRRLWVIINNLPLTAATLWLAAVVARYHVGFYDEQPRSLVVFAFAAPVGVICTSRLLTIVRVRRALVMLLSRMCGTRPGFDAMLAPLSGVGAPVSISRELALEPRELCALAASEMQAVTLDEATLAELVVAFRVGTEAAAQGRDAMDALSTVVRSSCSSSAPTRSRNSALWPSIKDGRVPTTALLHARASRPQLRASRPAGEPASGWRGLWLLARRARANAPVQPWQPRAALAGDAGCSLSDNDDNNVFTGGRASAGDAIARQSFGLSTVAVSSQTSRSTACLVPPSATGLSPAGASLAMPSGPPVADAYVLYDWADGLATAKARALSRWAEQFEARHGRAPTVWVDALCANESLLPIERLARTSATMACCRQLLVLWGPRFVESEMAVALLVAWHALGGSAANSTVLVIGETRADLAAVPESVDAFACTRLRRMRPAERGRDQLAVVGAQISEALDYATAGRVNELVRARLPELHAGAIELSARNAARARASPQRRGSSMRSSDLG